MSDSSKAQGDVAESTTKSLVRRTQAGDSNAANRLFARLLAAIRRWSHGRLPKGSRDLVETADLAQDVVIGTWRNLDRISLKRPGDLEAYVRQAVRNRIRDQARRVERQPDPTSVDSAIPASLPSALDIAMHQEMWGAYRKALQELDLAEREVIIARFEFGYSYEEIADLLDRPSPAAARMAVNRAVERLRVLVGSR